VNVALIEFAGTVTLDGTVATLVLLLERVTVTPEPVAAAFNVMVPVELTPETPPMVEVGLSVKLEIVVAAGITVNVVV